ncbi:MAG: hypothetical protein ACI4RT_00315 [Candidatus Spyradenecus sp.]
MKTEITVDWSPLKTLIKRFPQEAKKALPLALNAAANELLNATDEAFTNPNNRQKAWPPLNPKTIPQTHPSSSTPASSNNTPSAASSTPQTTPSASNPPVNTPPLTNSVETTSP